METLWETEANTLTWDKKWKTVLDSSNPYDAQWFVDGKISFCYNAVDRHANSDHGDKTAIIHECPSLNLTRNVTYKELKENASLLAGALVNHGVQKGDIIFAYLPNILEGPLLYLASTRIGAIFCCTTYGTAVTALTDRIDELKPKLIITTSYSIIYNSEVHYKGILDEALQNCKHQPAYCIVVQREEFRPAHLCRPRDITWDEFLEKTKPMDCVSVESNHPLFICYTSGSTATGRAHVYRTGGVCVGTKFFTRKLISGSEVWFPGANLGWIIGINVSISGTLLLGKTTILLEGDALTPNAGNYFRIISKYDIEVISISTPSINMISKQDPEGIYAKQYDISKLRIIHAGGEEMVDKIRDYVSKVFGPHVILSSGYGQTEAANYICYPSETAPFDGPATNVGIPAPEFRITIVDDESNELEAGQLGNIVYKLPLPPCFTSGIFMKSEQFKTEYMTRLKGYFETKDIGMILPNGELCVQCRTDGLVKVGIATVRINLYEIENTISLNAAVREVVVACASHSQYSLVPVAFYTSTTDSDFDNLKKIALSRELANQVAKDIGDLPKFQYSFQVKALPKTASSGKLARGVVKEFVKNYFPTVAQDQSYEENWNMMNEVLEEYGYSFP